MDLHKRDDSSEVTITNVATSQVKKGSRKHLRKGLVPVRKRRISKEDVKVFNDCLCLITAYHCMSLLLVKLPDVLTVSLVGSGGQHESGQSDGGGRKVSLDLEVKELHCELIQAEILRKLATGEDDAGGICGGGKLGGDTSWEVSLRSWFLLLLPSPQKDPPLRRTGRAENSYWSLLPQSSFCQPLLPPS